MSEYAEAGIKATDESPHTTIKARNVSVALYLSIKKSINAFI